MKKILVVDDDPSTRHLLHKMLSKKYRITLASDGVECLSQLHYDPSIDLVIIDISMPVLNGLETLGYIRNKAPKTLNNKPIFVISSQRNLEYLNKAKRLKADGWLTKPPSQKDLLSFVDRFIATR